MSKLYGFLKGPVRHSGSLPLSAQFAMAALTVAIALIAYYWKHPWDLYVLIPVGLYAIALIVGHFENNFTPISDARIESEPSRSRRIAVIGIKVLVLGTAALLIAYFGDQHQISLHCRSKADPSIAGTEYCIRPHAQPKKRLGSFFMQTGTEILGFTAAPESVH